MRIKLTLNALRRATTLPLNYQHAVASLIYATLGQASAEFVMRLHGEGFRVDGRNFRLFTFSRLAARRSRVAGDHLLLEDPTVSLQVSSPVSDFVSHFVSGLHRRKVFQIAGARF